jgi:hypothetical protein
MSAKREGRRIRRKVGRGRKGLIMAAAVTVVVPEA